MGSVEGWDSLEIRAAHRGGRARIRTPIVSGRCVFKTLELWPSRESDYESGTFNRLSM